MENTSFDSPFEEVQELRISKMAVDFLASTAKWARFLAILGFIMTGFMALGGLGFMVAGGKMTAAMSFPFAGMGSFLGLIYIAIAGVLFLPYLYLFRFAQNTKLAVESMNSDRITEAFSNLRAHYRFLGIVAIIFLGIYGIMILFALVAGAGAALAG